MKRALIFNGELVRYVDGEPSDGDLTTPHKSKPHVVPVVEEAADFDPVSQTRGAKQVRVEDDRVVWSWPVADKTEVEIDGMRAAKVVDIKAEAQRRILEIMPAHQQTNWLALKAEMDLRHGTDPANWPKNVRDSVQVVLPKWDAIKALRLRSNEKEAALAALTDPHEIDAYDAGAGWE